jgi:hypothetical protein
VLLEVLRGPGETHHADLVLPTPGQASPIEEAISGDLCVAAQQLNGTIKSILYFPVDVPLIVDVIEKAFPARRGECSTDGIPALLVERGFFVSKIVRVENRRPCTESPEVSIERAIYPLREIMVIERQMQDEPDYFPLNETISFWSGGVETKSGVMVGHRLTPS